MLNQCSIPPTEKPPRSDSTASYDPLQREDVGARKQLESCHVGNPESKDHIIQRSSLHSITGTLPEARVAWNLDPIFTSVPSRQLPAPSASVPLLDVSKPLVQRNIFQQVDWRPLDIGNSVSKKRKLDAESAPAYSGQWGSKSPQISPRTTPASLLPSSRSPLRESVVDPSDMRRTPDVPSLQGNRSSNKLACTSSAEFDSNTLDCVDVTEHRLQSRHQPILVDIVDPNNQFPPTSRLPQPMFCRPQSRKPWQQSIPRVSQAQYRFPAGPFQHPQPFPAYFQQAGAQLSRSQLPAIRNPICQPPSDPRQSFNESFLPQSKITSCSQNSPSQEKMTSTLSSTSRLSSQSRRAERLDLLRKPSLYKHPAWPSPPEARPPQMQIPTIHFQSQPQISNMPGSGILQPSTIPIGLGQSSRSTQPGKHPIRNFETNPRSSISSSNRTPHVTATKSDTFEPPRARTSRKHSPNLYVKSRSSILFIC